MPHYKIADIVCKFTPRFEETYNWYKPYETDEPLDFENELMASDSEIDYLVENGVNITDYIAENMIFCSKFNRVLVKFNGTYIHSSALLCEDGKVYLISGNSGVGKSTLTQRWCNMFPDRAKVINDDKPSIRIIDGKCFVYGTPFAGGTDIQENLKGELGAIIFLEQSDVNRIEPVSAKMAVRYLMEQSPKNQTIRMAEKVLDMYDTIISNYPIYKLYCTNSDEAVEVAIKIVNNFERNK